MTTVAYKDGVLAVDSMTAEGCLNMGSCKKLGVCGEYVYGFSGEVQDIPDIERAIMGAKDVSLNDCCAIAVHKSGKVFIINDKGVKIQVNSSCYATGSGGHLAIGAMEHGATAFEAVTIACRRDTYSGLPVKTLSIKDVFRA